MNQIAAILMMMAIGNAGAREVKAPGGKWSIRAENTINLIDSTGRTILILVPFTSKAAKIEVQWNPDSSKVVVVENTGRGSAVFAAFLEGDTWHKAIEADQDITRLIKARGIGSRLIAEHRTLGAWRSDDSIEVNAEWTFSDGRTVRDSYTLEFLSRFGRMDRGGYEEGVIRANG
jgi:hypothetical protein